MPSIVKGGPGMATTIAGVTDVLADAAPSPILLMAFSFT